MKPLFAILLFSAALVAQTTPPTPQCCPEASIQNQQLLWDKLQSTVAETDRDLDGVLGVAIFDLTGGQTLLLHPDNTFPQASSIKIAVLAELYHQAQQSAEGVAGKAKLTDLYTVQQSDIVPGSDIMEGLSPGVTRVTLRDLATMMIAVSDNSATNVLIDRLGMDNVNALLDSLGLKATRLRRRMMDVKAAAEGRENVATPREMMTLLTALYRGKVLNKELTADYFKMLSTHKDSPIRKTVPGDVPSADKPGELEAVRTDSGVVLLKNRPFVICVMTTFLRHEEEGQAAIRKITAAAYSYFDRVGRASQYGRVVSPGDTSRP